MFGISVFIHLFVFEQKMQWYTSEVTCLSHDRLEPIDKCLRDVSLFVNKGHIDRWISFDLGRIVDFDGFVVRECRRFGDECMRDGFVELSGGHRDMATSSQIIDDRSDLIDILTCLGTDTDRKQTFFMTKMLLHCCQEFLFLEIIQ